MGEAHLGFVKVIARIVIAGKINTVEISLFTQFRIVGVKNTQRRISMAITRTCMLPFIPGLYRLVSLARVPIFADDPGSSLLLIVVAIRVTICIGSGALPV